MPRFPSTGFLRVKFPSFLGTIKALRLPAARPAARRCLRLAVPRSRSLGFAPRRPSAPPRPGVGHPVAPAGISPRRRQDLPSSWGISIVRLHMFLPTPAGLLTPDHYGATARPLDPQVQRLPHWVFRRPIAWLSDWLSTLRRADYSKPTQDSLPVAGQALPDGLSTHKIPMRGFKIVSLHLYPPLPSFAWRNGGDRRAQGRHTVRNRGDGCWIRLHSGGTEKREGGLDAGIGASGPAPRTCISKRSHPRIRVKTHI